MDQTWYMKPLYLIKENTHETKLQFSNFHLLRWRFWREPLKTSVHFKMCRNLTLFHRKSVDRITQQEASFDDKLMSRVQKSKRQAKESPRKKNSRDIQNWRQTRSRGEQSGEVEDTRGLRTRAQRHRTKKQTYRPKVKEKQRYKYTKPMNEWNTGAQGAGKQTKTGSGQ